MAETLSCLLHIGPSMKDEVVYLFNKETWETVLQIAEKRRTLYKKSKYTPLIDSLPQIYSDHDGYHRSCYKNFTAIPKGSDRPDRPSVNPAAGANYRWETRSRPESMKIIGARLC
jgi:hypothetical protein